MAFDEGLAQRIRENLTGLTKFEEKKMFGGISFLHNGKMICGVIKNDLIVRVGPDKYDELMKKPYTKEFDFTGRPMTGWIVVTPKAIEKEKQLSNWIEHGLNYAKSLPAK